MMNGRGDLCIIWHICTHTFTSIELNCMYGMYNLMFDTTVHGIHATTF